MKQPIQILSIDNDPSTSDVIEWLNHYHKEYIRINNMIFMDDFLNIEILNARESDNQGSLWYRRNGVTNRNITQEFETFYRNENRKLQEFVFSENKYDKIVGRPLYKPINKLKDLKNANDFGLKVPDTLITNSKKRLEKFFSIHKKIITKPISDQPIIKSGKEIQTMYTKIVDQQFIDSLPYSFPTSLFQQYIEKEFEIRAFYLNNKLYSMAILSQGDKKTKIDYRQYNENYPNRTVPYKLPEHIEENLMRFLHNNHLEASSSDLIKCLDGNYYFLEANPWGQFGMVSYPCNYYLEKKIAELL